MLFESSRQAGRVPLLLIAGTCATSTTAFVNVLVAHASLADSVVISTARKDRELPQRARIIELPVLETSAQDNCLCCGMHSALGDTLRKLFFEALNDRGKRLDRVLIESASINTGQLAHTLRHTPFLGQRYFHQFTFRVVTETQLFSTGIDALVGLDPIGDSAKQFLVIAKSGQASSCGDAMHAKHKETPSQAQLQAWQATIARELPYREVLRMGHDSLPDSLGLS